MAKRIFSTILLWAVVIASLRFFGAQGGVWLIAILGVATQREFYQLLGKMGHRPFSRLGLAFGAVMLLAPYYLTRYVFDAAPELALTEIIVALAVIACCLRVLREREAGSRIETLASTLLGLIYIPFMLQFFVRILLLYQDPDDGVIICVWLAATAKFCDVGALLTGLAFGRHPMAPGISPKKTWEGAVGGLVAAAVVGAGIAWYFADGFPENFTPAVAALCAVPLAAAAILSDLIESVLKRRADIKDTGALVPGIGGIFDLTDSLILTAPLGYSLFYFLQ